MNEEIKSRLDGVLAGPWADTADIYTNFISTPTESNRGYAIRSMTGNDTAALKLKKILRPHWQSPITSDKEAEIRNSLDEALSTLQLLELGVETGYFDVEDIREEATKRIDLWLGSEAARNYLVYYDFIGVRFLAGRLGIDLGLPKVTAPRINPKASVRFAAFRAQHLCWYEYEDLEAFLGLMDDYVYYDNEQQVFSRYLTTGNLRTKDDEMKAHFNTLKEGMVRFITLLSGLAAILEEEEHPYFGVFYSYWMAKFFGYKLQEDGYKVSGSSINWSAVALQMGSATADAEDSSGVELTPEEKLFMKEAWIGKIKKIRQMWDTTRLFIQQNLTRP